MDTAEPIMRRLAFVRYLHGVAEQQSRQPEPLAAASLLTFHDAVELFLVLGGEQRGITLRSEVGFMRRWDKLESRLNGATLPHRTGIERLNDLRVRLKHDGYIPAKSEVEGTRATVAAFFQESTPLLFAIPFDRISLVELVSSTEARASLAEAETLIGQGALRQSMYSIAVAFHQAVREYQTRTGTSLHLTSRRFGESYASLPASGPFAEFAQIFNSVRNEIDQLKSAMSVLLVGVDYSRYLRFTELVPSMTEKRDGSYRWLPKWVPPGWPTEEDCRFCFGFVVEAAVQLQQCEWSPPLLLPRRGLLGTPVGGELLGDPPPPSP